MHKQRRRYKTDDVRRSALPQGVGASLVAGSLRLAAIMGIANGFEN
jgi:hypothetical protein